jgi:hypothetical protein
MTALDRRPNRAATPRSPSGAQDPWQRRVWSVVSSSPLRSLWDLQGVHVRPRVAEKDERATRSTSPPA